MRVAAIQEAWQKGHGRSIERRRRLAALAALGLVHFDVISPEIARDEEDTSTADVGGGDMFASYALAPLGWEP